MVEQFSNLMLGKEPFRAQSSIGQCIIFKKVKQPHILTHFAAFHVFRFTFIQFETEFHINSLLYDAMH